MIFEGDFEVVLPKKKIRACVELTFRRFFAPWSPIQIGNMQQIRIWTDAWLQGIWPKDIAPNLFVRTKGKNKTLAQALQHNNWIRGSQLLIWVQPHPAPQILHTDLEPCKSGGSSIDASRPNFMEIHTECPILNGVYIQGTVHWGHQKSDHRLHLGSLGSTEMQIFRLDRANQSLVVGPPCKTQMGS